VLIGGRKLKMDKEAFSSVDDEAGDVIMCQPLPQHSPMTKVGSH